METGPERLELLGKLLKAGGESARSAAGELITCLDNPDPGTRQKARFLLAETPGPSVPALEQALLSGGSGMLMKEQAAATLEETGTGESEAALAGALSHGDPAVWRPALGASGMPPEQHPELDLRNWHPGDPHVHSEYSGSDLSGLPLIRHLKGINRLLDLKRYDSPESMVLCAVNRHGLSWLAFTDHGPDLGVVDRITGLGSKTDFEVARTRWNELKDRLLKIELTLGRGCFMPGEELGTVQGAGHLLVLGNREYIPACWKEADQKLFLSQAERSGGFSFIAHPYLNRTTVNPFSRFASYYWHWFPDDLAGIDFDSALRGFELLNGNYLNPERKEGGSARDRMKMWSQPDMATLAGDWDRSLEAGSRTVVIGGSDAHRVKELGKVRTYVFLEGGRPFLKSSDYPELLQGIRRGNTVLGTGPLLAFLVTNLSTGETATAGEVLPAAAGDSISFEYRHAGFGAQGPQAVALVSSITENSRVSVEGNPFRFRVDENLTRERIQNGYLRVEARGRRGHKCYGNPVFFVHRYARS